MLPAYVAFSRKCKDFAFLMVRFAIVGSSALVFCSSVGFHVVTFFSPITLCSLSDLPVVGSFGIVHSFETCTLKVCSIATSVLPKLRTGSFSFRLVVSSPLLRSGENSLATQCFTPTPWVTSKSSRDSHSSLLANVSKGLIENWFYVKESLSMLALTSIFHVCT